LGFLSEASQIFFVGDEMRRENFDGDWTTESRVKSFVHHTHAATAKLFENSVMRNKFSNHRRCLLQRESSSCGLEARRDRAW
jgi:hypothetical protein